MTDERIGDRLLPTIRRLPPGSGIVFRHLDTPRRARLALFRQVGRIAVARRIVVVAVGGAGLSHGGPRPFTAPAHSRREAIAGARAGAVYLFVSPIFPTRSHPGAPALGVRRAAGIASGLGMSAIALGGMSERAWRQIRRYRFGGWAAIDALTVRRPTEPETTPPPAITR